MTDLADARAPRRAEQMPVTRSRRPRRELPSPQHLASLQLAEWHAVRRPRATRTPTAHAFRDPVSVVCPRPAIMRHDPGLAASPPVRYMLKVERSCYSLSVVVRCGPSNLPRLVRARCTRSTLLAVIRHAAYLPCPARGRDDLMTIADWAPRHVRPYIETVIAAIQADPRVVGLTAAGSAATGTMDEFSDLDLVVVCRDEHQPETAPRRPRLRGPPGAAARLVHRRARRRAAAAHHSVRAAAVHVDLKFVTDSQLDDRVEDGLVCGSVTTPRCGTAPGRSGVAAAGSAVDRGPVLDLAPLRRRQARAAASCSSASTCSPPCGRSCSDRSLRRDSGHRAAGVGASAVAPGLGTGAGGHGRATLRAAVLHALHASVALYRQLRGDAPALVRRTSAEAAASITSLRSRQAARPSSSVTPRAARRSAVPVGAERAQWSHGRIDVTRFRG